MPKKIWKINKFSGGLNDYSDPRDINPSELTLAQDCEVSKSGQISNIGSIDTGLTESGSSIPDMGASLAPNPGYGLFYFSSDTQMINPEASITTTLEDAGSPDVAPTGKIKIYRSEANLSTDYVWDSDESTTIYGRIKVNNSVIGTTFTVADETTFNAFATSLINGIEGASSGYSTSQSNTNQWLTITLTHPTVNATANTHAIVLEFNTANDFSGTTINASGGGGQNRGWYATQGHGGNPSQFTYNAFSGGAAGSARQYKVLATPPSSAGTYYYSVEFTNSADSHLDTFSSTETTANGLRTDLDTATTGGDAVVDTIQADNTTNINIANVTGGVTFTAASNGNNYFTVNMWMNDASLGDNGDNHIVFADKNGKCAVHHESTNSWEALRDNAGSAIDISTGSNCQASYYSDSGNLRLCNGNFDEGNPSAKWFGYINRTTLLASRLSISGWYSTNYEIAGSGNWIRDAVTTITAGDPNDADTNVVEIYIPTPSVDSTTNDTPWNGNYKFYISSYFDDSEQETLIFETLNSGTAIDATDDHKLTISVNIRAKRDDGTLIYPERMTGFRLYYSKETEGYGIKYALCDLDFKDGVRRWDGGATTSWSTVGTYSVKAENITFDGEQGIHTYESINGYLNDSDFLTVEGWKTSTITNRRCFIGNVTIDGKVYSDRMIVSPYNKFDVFPESNVLDVVVNDGEEIIKLESYADRVLQFKQSTMYIINVSEVDAEFVEDTHKFRGIINPNHSCWTASGIAWINEHGAFLYDGELVLALTEKADIGRTLSKDTWESFISKDSIIGYDAISDTLIIKRSAVSGATDETDAFHYDFVAQAWTTSTRKFSTNVNLTNFITRKDGTLIVLQDTEAGDGGQAGGF